MKYFSWLISLIFIVILASSCSCQAVNATKSSDNQQVKAPTTKKKLSDVNGKFVMPGEG